jgi:hypothetical protein
MSSNRSTKFPTNEDLDILRRVLKDEGYTDSIFSDPRTSGIAGMLLIRLFQEGVRNPAELANQLVLHFGRPDPDAIPPAASPLHRFAIQGLPADLMGPVR